MLDLHAVVADEPPPEIVEREPVLGAAVGGFPGIPVGSEPEVGATQHNRRSARGRGRDHVPARQPAGQVNPVVDRERRVAHAQLGAPGRREAREEDPALVGLAVAVRVSQEEHVRGARDDQPSLPGHDAVGVREPLGELGPAIHAPIAVGVLQQRDPAGRGLARAGTGGIAAVLGHVQPAALIERHRDRARNQRFGRDQLQSQTGLHMEGRRSLFGAERPIECASRQGGLRRPVWCLRESGIAWAQGDERRGEHAPPPAADSVSMVHGFVSF